MVTVVRSVALGAGGEFDLIRRLVADGGALCPEVLVGPGDDAAVLEGGWVVSTDLSVEGVHFRRDWLSDREVGYRAATAALSDLAAMAARPVGVLVSIALPVAPDGDAPEGTGAGAAVDPEAVQAGVRDAASVVGASVIGGDVTRSPGPLVLDVVVLGRADAPVLRAGAREGDEIWVTGALGAAAAAVRVWEGGGTPPAAAREAFARPVARVSLALALAQAGALHALIDLSDGLAGDAGHLAAAGRVRITLEAARVPVAEVAVEVLGPDGARDAALHGGEDYELCFAARPGAIEPATLGARFGVPLTRVGTVAEGSGVWLRALDGSERPVARGGFSHLPEVGG